MRQSIGPAIRVSERGSHGCFCAGHHGRRDHRLHAGLADGDDVRARAEVLEHLDQVVDILLEPEAALRQRHFARVLPVGDVDVMVLQHGLHGVAQEGGEVAGQGRDDQHLRLGRVDVLPEVQQAAEGQVERGLFDDQRFAVLDHHRLDAEGLGDMRQLGACRHFQRGHKLAGSRRIRRAVQRRPHLQRSERGSAKRRRSLHLGLVNVVPHIPARSILRQMRDPSSFLNEA